MVDQTLHLPCGASDPSLVAQAVTTSTGALRRLNGAGRGVWATTSWVMGCRARGGRGAFMVRSWVGRVQNLGCISGSTPSLVPPKLPVHRCTPSGDVRYRLVHHNHIGSGLFRAPAATPLSLSGHPGVGRVSRAETVQLVAGLGLGSLIWMVNDFPDGQGALTKRSGRAVERALRGGFPGVPPERRGARAAAAIARLVRSEAVGGTARTPCAFAERGVRLTGRSLGAGPPKVRWGHPSPSSRFHRWRELLPGGRPAWKRALSGEVWRQGSVSHGKKQRL